MKKYLVLTAAAFSSLGLSIANISEDDVTESLRASKVIEISREAASKLVLKGSDCEGDLHSKSARAYVVKKAKASILYVTDEDVDGLTECVELKR